MAKVSLAKQWVLSQTHQISLVSIAPVLLMGEVKYTLRLSESDARELISKADVAEDTTGWKNNGGRPYEIAFSASFRCNGVLLP